MGLAREEWLWAISGDNWDLASSPDGPLTRQAQLVEDFRALRQAAEDMQLFEARPAFFALLLGHILAMELLAWLVVYLLGPGWLPSTLTALILTVSQVTAVLQPLTCPTDTRGHSGLIG